MNDHLQFIEDQARRGLPNVDSSKRCTLHCADCARAHLKMPKGSYERKYMKARFNVIKDMVTDSMEKLFEFFDNGVGMCGQISDPVFNPNFMDFLELKRVQFPKKRFVIHTAANQKTLEWYRQAFELSDKNTDWVFGLDGLTDTSMIYREGQNSQIIMDAMILGRSMGVNIRWQYIVFEYNEHQIEEAKKIAAKHGIEMEFMATNRVSNNPNVKVPEKYLQKKDKKIVQL